MNIRVCPLSNSNADITSAIFTTEIEAERQKFEMKVKVANTKNVSGISYQMVHTSEFFAVSIFQHT